MSRGVDEHSDDDLDVLLEDLEATLDALEGELREEHRRRWRPPTPGELLRFTEQYTIPTLIAILEATIQSLRLFRRLLQVADPQGGRLADDVKDAGSRFTPDRFTPQGTREDVTQGVTTALSELRTALRETDLPQDPEAQSIVREARDLSEEIERRLEQESGVGTIHRESTDDGATRKDGAERKEAKRKEAERKEFDRGVTIEVTDESTTDEADADEAATEEAPSDDPGVDVEAELQSIKDDLDESTSDGDEPDGDDTGGDDLDDDDLDDDDRDGHDDRDSEGA